MALNLNRIIIIAGSYGAHQPTKLLLTNLKPSLPVAIVVAFHLAGSLMPRLAEVNGYSSAFVKDGEVIKPGYIYIAPPDHHLFIDKAIFRLTKGPRVNLVRPAFDLIFRSAAVNWGVQVIGVLLSGLLDDGTAGLKAIKACGGMAIVQDPEDAECPEMPQNAIRYGAIDHIAAASEIGDILSEIAMQPVPMPKALALEHAFDSQTEDVSNLDDIGRPASIVCPECNGPLWGSLKVAGHRAIAAI
jgi:two-component system chemotaxis response regulator CheB